MERLPEEIFTSSYYNTRPMQFFKFYHEEILDKIPEPGPSSHIMAAMERAGHLHCIITSNIFDQEKEGRLRKCNRSPWYDFL